MFCVVVGTYTPVVAGTPVCALNGTCKLRLHGCGPQESSGLSVIKRSPYQKNTDKKLQRNGTANFAQKLKTDF